MKSTNRLVKRIENAIGFPSFSRYMNRCLYDHDFGYYSVGKVQFGEDEHFWTYPQRISPLFGCMIAESARKLVDAMSRVETLSKQMPFYIVELGGGEGQMALDTLDYMHSRQSIPAWAPLLQHFQYIIVDSSPALHKRLSSRLDRYIQTNYVDIRTNDAVTFLRDWDEPFHGLVIANELITAFPCERLRIVRPGPLVHRIHISPRLASPGRSPELLTEQSFWELLAQSTNNPSPPPLEITELEVPLSQGWLEHSEIHEVPENLCHYLTGLADLIDDLAICELLPTDLHWSPLLPEFVSALKSFISGPERQGVAFIIDYGGTSRHVLDPRSYGPHLRIYGPETEHAHKNSPYLAPSRYDITWDLDFTELAKLAQAKGLNVLFYGHQRALETFSFNLTGNQAHLLTERLIAEEFTENHHVPASFEAYDRIIHFREAPGFHLMVLCSASLPLSPHGFGAGDHYEGEGLLSLKKGVVRTQLEQVLEALNISARVAEFLKPCGDLIADLSNCHLYDLRFEIIQRLGKRGWLAPPGSIE